MLPVNDLADNVSLEGEVVGRSAALFAFNKLPKREIGLRIKAGENVGQIVPEKIVNGEEPVRISMRGKLPMNDSEVVFENSGLVFKRRYICPAEMVTVQLKKDDMWRLRVVREEVIKYTGEVIIPGICAGTSPEELAPDMPVLTPSSAFCPSRNQKSSWLLQTRHG